MGPHGRERLARRVRALGRGSLPPDGPFHADGHERVRRGGQVADRRGVADDHGGLTRGPRPDPGPTVGAPRRGGRLHSYGSRTAATTWSTGVRGVVDTARAITRRAIAV